MLFEIYIQFAIQWAPNENSITNIENTRFFSHKCPPNVPQVWDRNLSDWVRCWLTREGTRKVPSHRLRKLSCALPGFGCAPIRLVDSATFCVAIGCHERNLTRDVQCSAAIGCDSKRWLRWLLPNYKFVTRERVWTFRTLVSAYKDGACAGYGRTARNVILSQTIWELNFWGSMCDPTYLILT